MDEAPLCWLHHELTADQALAIGSLKARTWRKPGKDAAYRSAQLLESGARECRRAELAARSFVLLDGGSVIAHAEMLPRETVTQEGPLWVLGLGGVCSDPDRRGEGLGARIVRAAFSMVDEGLARFSLFQTSHQVKPFYDQLGCCLVENRIFDSTGEDPEANPFWDEVAMRYPAGKDWPDGPIDLCGPGY